MNLVKLDLVALIQLVEIIANVLRNIDYIMLCFRYVYIYTAAYRSIKTITYTILNKHILL